MDTKSIDSLLCTLLAEGTGWRGKGDGIPAPSVITVLSLNSHFIAQWPPFFAESAKTESEAGLRPRGLVVPEGVATALLIQSDGALQTRGSQERQRKKILGVTK